MENWLKYLISPNIQNPNLNVLQVTSCSTTVHHSTTNMSFAI